MALSLYDSHVSSVKAKEICCISYHPEDGPNEKQKRPQKHVPFVNRKGRYILQSRPRKTSTSSSECTELNSTEKDFSFSKTYRHWEKKELQIDIDDVKTNLPVKKSIEFSFDDVIEVVVQHFIESPTLACWVISQEDIEKSDQILKQINMHRSFEAIEDDKIKINHKYCVLFEGVYHRGVVIYRINSLEVLVHLIDNGRTLRTKTNALSQLKNVPANLDGLAIQIKFETMCSIAINELLRIRIVSIDSDGMMNVCCVEEEKIFTQNDITSTPLPENLPVELFCLGYTNIDKGYISVCQNDREKIKFIDDISNQISDYCNQTNDGQGYTPKLNELCLAYFDEEGGWYRAKCVKEILSNTFDLLMIDYGPVFPVKSKNIRKMTKEFIVQPLIMHRCVINGKFFFYFHNLVSSHIT